ncbi:recombination protein NinB [Variovorax sp. GT1P44]|uniref:recombination protein NinB n=1 Tax=Variovorax sp. GT1P44 TaxID=3443742 RepID=UPI003F44DA20
MSAVTVYNPVQAATAWNAIYEREVKPLLMAGHRGVLSFKRETRSTQQNARMWAMLQDVADQVEWHGRKLSKEDWKHIFSASLKKQDAVPGIDGGFVVLGQSTSKMTVGEMADLMTLMEAFGAERDVRFTAPKSWGDGR